MELRPYQQDLINKIRNELAAGKRRICVVLGCGGGKSIIQSSIAKSANERGNRVLYLIHRKELAQQIQRTFTAGGVNPCLTTIGMINTMARIKNIPTPSIIMIDECHHSLSKTYLNLLSRFPNAIVLGFTATPQRLGEGGLGKVFEMLVEGVSTEWLITHHYLAPYRYFSVTIVNTKKLGTRMGEYKTEDIEALMNRRKVFGDTVTNWQAYAKGKKTIVYCSSIATSKATAEAFSEQGIAAAHLDGTTPPKERAQVVDDFRAGNIKVLCNVDLFGEGFDVPDCECVVLLRPTKSLTLYIQQSMRSMRINPENPGKVAIIIDHVGNYLRHGLPDDKREWILETKKSKADKERLVQIKMCPNCFTVVSAKWNACPFCGTEFTVEAMQEAEVINTELVEIHKKLLKDRFSKMQYSDVASLKTWDELEMYRKTHHKADGSAYRLQWSIYKAQELGISIPEKYDAFCWRMGL